MKKKLSRVEENKMAAYALAIIFSLLLILIVLTGCRPVQYIQGETITKEVRVVERDTAIVTVADSASAAALLYCDSSYNIVLGELSLSEGERIKLEWQLALTQKNGRNMASLNIGAKEDEHTAHVSMRDSIKTEIIERNIVEYRNSDFARFCVGWFWASLAIIVIGLAIWIGKKYLRL